MATGKLHWLLKYQILSSVHFHKTITVFFFAWSLFNKCNDQFESFFNQRVIKGNQDSSGNQKSVIQGQKPDMENKTNTTKNIQKLNNIYEVKQVNE